MRVLVTGATGFLGGHLVDRLLARGHRVTALARATSRTEELEARGVEVVRVDLARPAELAEPIRRAEALVHAAGGGIVRDVAGFYRGNTETTRRLLEVAAVHGALHRFVLVSSLAAHGPSAPGRPAREEDPDAPRSHYGKSKRAAEQAALCHAELFGVTVLRPPALYGPGEHRMVPLFRAAARGVVPMVHPAGTLSLLSGRDCAEAIARALEAPHPSGVYYVAEPQPITRRAMAEAIGAAVGRRVRVLPVPGPLFAGIGAASELAGRLRDRPVMLGLDKVRDASRPHQACAPTRAMKTLGWTPRDRFAEGAREAWDDYRRRGWL